jgi:cytochrome c556
LLLNNAKTQDQMVYHAEGIVESFKRIGRAFPAGSDKGITKASPKIWENQELFNERGKTAFTAATTLVEALQTDQDKAALISAYRDLGASCKACHDDFRLK